MVIVRIWEGLGNQLFQYAYAKSLQLRTGYKVCLDNERMYKAVLEHRSTEREYTLDKFRISLPIAHKFEKKYNFIEQKNLMDIIKFAMSKERIIFSGFYREETPCFKEELKNIRDNYYLMGWFQSEKYFKEYSDVIRKDLKPRKKIAISSYLHKLLKEENTVAMHIRRGDYKRYHNTLPVYYYEQARKYVESKINQPFYIIFSDDMEWVKKELDFGLNSFYMSEERLKDYEELLVMSKCKHNIIANSTFSWWGAWLNDNKDKIVVGPKSWVSCKNSFSNNILPDEWIKI